MSSGISAYLKKIMATGESAASSGASAMSSLSKSGTSQMNARSSKLISSMPGVLMPKLTATQAKAYAPKVTTTSTSSKKTKKTSTSTASANTASSDTTVSSPSATTQSEQNFYTNNKAAVQKATAARRASNAQANTQSSAPAKTASASALNKLANSATVGGKYSIQSGAPRHESIPADPEYKKQQEAAKQKAAQEQATENKYKATQGYQLAAQADNSGALASSIKAGKLPMQDTGVQYYVASSITDFLADAGGRDAYAAVMNAKKDNTGAALKKLESSGYYDADTIRNAENIYALADASGLSDNISTNYYGDHSRDGLDVYRKIIGKNYILYDNIYKGDNFDTTTDSLGEKQSQGMTLNDSLNNYYKQTLADYDSAKRLSAYDLSNLSDWNDGQKQAAYEYVENWKDTASKSEKELAARIQHGDSADTLRAKGYTDSEINSVRNVIDLSKHKGFLTTEAQNKVFGTAAADLTNMVGGVMSVGSNALGIADDLLGTDLQGNSKEYTKDLLANGEKLNQDASLGLVGNLANSIAENVVLGTLGDVPRGYSGLLTGLSMQGAGDQARSNYESGASDLSNLLSTVGSFGYNYALNKSFNPLENGLGERAQNYTGLKRLLYGISEGAVDNAIQDVASGTLDTANNAAVGLMNGKQLPNESQADETAWLKERANSAAMAGLSGGILGGLSGGLGLIGNTEQQKAADNLLPLETQQASVRVAPQQETPQTATQAAPVQNSTLADVDAMLSGNAPQVTSNPAADAMTAEKRIVKQESLPAISNDNSASGQIENEMRRLGYDTTANGGDNDATDAAYVLANEVSSGTITAKDAAKAFAQVYDGTSSPNVAQLSQAAQQISSQPKSDIEDLYQTGSSARDIEDEIFNKYQDSDTEPQKMVSSIGTDEHLAKNDSALITEEQRESAYYESNPMSEVQAELGMLGYDATSNSGNNDLTKTVLGALSYVRDGTITPKSLAQAIAELYDGKTSPDAGAAVERALQFDGNSASIANTNLNGQSVDYQLAHRLQQKGINVLAPDGKTTTLYNALVSPINDGTISMFDAEKIIANVNSGSISMRNALEQIGNIINSNAENENAIEKNKNYLTYLKDVDRMRNLSTEEQIKEFTGKTTRSALGKQLKALFDGIKNGTISEEDAIVEADRVAEKIHPLSDYHQHFGSGHIYDFSMQSRDMSYTSQKILDVADSGYTADNPVMNIMRRRLSSSLANSVRDSLVTNYFEIENMPKYEQSDAESEAEYHAGNVHFYKDLIYDDGSFPEITTENAPYDQNTVGAAQAGETYVSRAADNTLANSELANDPAANKIIQDMRAEGKFDVQSVSEARSVRNAQNMLQTDFDAEAKRLTQDGVDLTNGGRDFDESMLLMSDRRTSPSDVRTLMQKTVQAWHNAGQALQSAAKYSRTSGTLLAKAQQSIDENGTYWATKNQKAQQQIEEIGDAWDAYLKNNSETLNSKSEIHDLLQNLIDKSALSDRLKNRIKPDSVEQLASIIASSKNTNGKALGQMFDNYFNSGLFGFSDESIQQVQDLFAEAENYNPNSKQFVDLTNQAYKVLAMQMGHSSWGQKFRALRYWNMLSSPRSYIKNGIGNVITGTTAIGDRAAKAIIESVYNKTHNGNEIHTSAIAVPARELAAAYKDFDNNAYAPSTKTSKFENVGGVERGIMSSTPIFKNKALESIRNIPGDILNEMDVNGMGGLLTWAKNLQGGNAVSSQMKQLGIATENAITKAGEHGIIGVGGIKNNYAREASSYAKANNASFSDLVETENAARSRIENGNALTENELLAADTTTEAEKTQIELLAKARAYAIIKSLETTFHNTNDIANTFSRATRTLQESDNLGARIAGYAASIKQPFVATPANMLVYGVNHSPIGLATTLGRIMYQSVSGNITKSDTQLIDSLAEGLNGTAIASLGALAAALGYINVTASGDDRKDYYEENINGKQNYSINTPNGTYTVSDILGPISIPFFTGASVYNSLQTRGITWSEAISALGGTLDPMIDTSVLTGIKSALQTIGGSPRNGNYAGAVFSDVASNLMSEMVPTVAKQIGRSFEPNVSSNYSSQDSYGARVIDKGVNKSTNWLPFLQDELSVDQWGDVNQNVGGNVAGRLAYNLLSPGYYAKAKDTSDISGVLDELYGATGSSTVYPESGIADPNVQLDDGSHRMTESEMQSYSETRGKTSYELAEELLKNADFSDLSAADKKETLGNIYSYANAAAKSDVFGDRYSMSSANQKLDELYKEYGAMGVVNYELAKNATAGDKSAGDKAQSVDALDMQNEERGYVYANLQGNDSTAMKALNQYGDVYAYYVMQMNADGITGSSKQADVAAWLNKSSLSNSDREKMYRLFCKDAKTDPFA